MEVTLKDKERLDDLGRNGYRIIQNKEKFCFGMDAVLLSDFARVKKGENVLDIGTGTGIIPILMESRFPFGTYTGLDIQEESIEMAVRSVALNGLSNKINMVTGDIKEAVSIFGTASFQVITTNPPYMTGNHGLVNENQQKAIARHEICCTLEDILSNSARLLQEHGRFYMVHRPFRLAEILSACVKYKLEPKRIRFVHSYVNKEPAMVLIEALKGGNSRVKVEPPLIIYKDVNVYTDEIYDIYGYER
ncbi:MAG: tRNA1(Val) (adenine(37)-N6)-methyltransferase [Lachnospiraceae bacterium]|nr:tRNA1(Val) (adenine(37)-N6)-methyltransferase [Lachnospiraceae bacterium]